MNRQIRKLGIALVVLFLTMIAQLNVLQVIKADSLANDPRNSRNAERDFGKPRGKIITADGRVLAFSTPNPNANSPYKYIRSYPGGSLYGQVTGYYSFTYGTVGVERYYNSDLAGRKVKLTAKRLKDVLNPKKVITSDVTLTINDRMQRACAKALGTRRGSIVASDPRTGAILCMVSTPRADPSAIASTDFKEAKAAFDRLNADERQPLLPRAYRRTLPPGSTFKTVTAATGLETKVVGLTTPSYPVVRSITPKYTTRPLRNFGGSECGGTLPSIFRVSCNTSFARMGLDLGPTKMHDGAQAFGFNRTPPLDLDPGAAPSSYPEVSFFRRNDPALAQSAIGQGQVRATPLQMCLVAAAIANKGLIMEPHVLQSTVDSEGVPGRGEPRNEWRRAVSEDTADKIKNLMIEVVNAGTAKRAGIQGIQVAAKTGTAQTGKGKTHLWIIAFAPAEESTVSVSVVLEDRPEVSGATGGKIAAPIARQVIEAVLSEQRRSANAANNTNGDTP